MCNILTACKPRATRKIQLRVPVSLHNLEQFFTLSHTLPLHDSHLNTGLLIAKIQANLERNKANKMVDKIQPYTKAFESSLEFAKNMDIQDFVLEGDSLNIVRALCGNSHAASTITTLIYGVQVS